MKRMFTGDAADDASPAAEAYVHDATGTNTLEKKMANFMATMLSLVHTLGKG